MSTETAFPDLRAFLNARLSTNGHAAGDGQKRAIEFPPDGGKSPTTGERFSENAADVRKVVGTGNVESAKEQTEDGSSKDVLPNSGLEQTIAGQEDSQTRSIKTIKDENEKIAKIDLTDPAGFDKAIASLEAAGQALKLASAPQQTKAPVQQPAFNPSNPSGKVDTKAAAERAVYETTKAYIKYGQDRAEWTARHLDGFTTTWDFLKRALDEGTLAALMSGAGGAGGGDPAAAAGGPPMAAPGGDAAAAPPMPPDAGGAGGGDPAAGGDQVSPDDVAGGMNEMGLNPQQIQEIIEILKGQLGGAEAPPEQKAAAVQSLEIATQTVKAAADHMRSGKYQFKPAADGRARKGRDTAKQYLNEILAAAGR